MDSKSRFIQLNGKTNRAKDEKGNLKQGQEVIIFSNRFGFEKIMAILNWKNGLLNSEPGIPAVQMEDTHTEYWTMGKLHNDSLNEEGEIMPAVISNYGEVEEYWKDGERIG